MTVGHPVEVQVKRGHWYQVALTAGTPSGRFEVRGRVKAPSPDAALRAVMCANGVSFAHDASIWLLGRRGAPTKRSNVWCRLPGVPSV